jgi:hypothetical protein
MLLLLSDFKVEERSEGRTPLATWYVSFFYEGERLPEIESGV